MARKTGLGPLGKEALSRTDNRVNPVLSAVIFQSLHSANKGATMNVHTGEVLTPTKSSGFVVGGEPSAEGSRIPTEETVGATPSLPVIMANRRRIRGLTAGIEDASMGSWVNTSKNVEWDASRKYESLPEAMRIARTRNEKAVYDVRRNKEVRNPDYTSNVGGIN